MPSTYGITPQFIADRINGFLLDDTSRPTIDTVELVIEEQAARVEGYLVAKGIAMPAGGRGELVVRSVIVDLVISYVERARSRGTTSLVDDAWERGRDTLDQIYDHPAQLGEPRGSRVANISLGAPSAQSENRCGRGRATLIERIAREGKL